MGRKLAAFGTIADGFGIARAVPEKQIRIIRRLLWNFARDSVWGIARFTFEFHRRLTPLRFPPSTNRNNRGDGIRNHQARPKKRHNSNSNRLARHAQGKASRRFRPGRTSRP